MMKRQRLVYFLLLLLAGCTNCDMVTYNNGPLSEDDLALSPYQDGQQVLFRHSAGQEIMYRVVKETRQVRDGCAECCKEWIYERNTSSLLPDYPVLSMEIGINNRDTTFSLLDVVVGDGRFTIPVSEDFSREYFTRMDSLEINDKFYRKVFKLKSGNSYGAPQEGTVYVDSLYYSLEAGFLKVVMSNEETYTLYE